MGLNRLIFFVLNPRKTQKYHSHREVARLVGRGSNWLKCDGGGVFGVMGE